ncbi:hypothetical protein BSY17_2631 [Sphingobium sp. RAC03]|nr:hypothetical protein BSY17_2631 [Sphingobium sp. RAC03]
MTFEALAAKYGWIWIGLTIGLAAKYALLIKRGVRIKLSLILADVLLLPMVALIAFWLAKQAGAEAEAAAMMTALATVGADRIVKLYTDRFIAQVQAMTLRDLTREVTESTGELRNAVQKDVSARRLTGLDD